MPSLLSDSYSMSQVYTSQYTVHYVVQPLRKVCAQGPNFWSLVSGQMFRLCVQSAEHSVQFAVQSIYSLLYSIYCTTLCCTTIVSLFYPVKDEPSYTVLHKPSYCGLSKCSPSCETWKFSRHACFRTKRRGLSKVETLRGPWFDCKHSNFWSFQVSENENRGSLISIFCTFDGVLQILFRLYFHTTMPGLLGAKILVYMSTIF